MLRYSLVTWTRVSTSRIARYSVCKIKFFIACMELFIFRWMRASDNCVAKIIFMTSCAFDRGGNAINVQIIPFLCVLPSRFRSIGQR